MCWLYLVQDVSDAPVPSDLSSTYKMTMLSSMLCQTTPATLISLHVQYMTACQGVATLSLAQKARLSKWRDR